MFNLDNSNWQKAGALRVYRKKSKSKKTSPKKRSSRRPSKKQLAALARGRAIRAKNIKKRRSGKKIQRGGRNPGTAATRRVAEEQRQLQAQEMQRKRWREQELLRLERQEEAQTAARLEAINPMRLLRRKKQPAGESWD
jgi:hypothetical protein